MDPLPDIPPESHPAVLVLTSTWPRWSADTEPRFVQDLCERLSGDFQLRVLAPHAPGSARREFAGGVTVYRYRYGFDWMERLAYDGGIVPKLRRHPLTWLLVPLFLLAQIVAIVRVLRREPVQVIHAHWLIPQAVCAVVAMALARRRVPLLCTVHGADLFALKSGMLGWLQREIARRCSRIGAVSGAIAQRLRELGVPDERITILPMGVPTGASTVSRDPAHVVFAGRLVEKKGVPLLLRAVADLRARGMALTLTVAGGGPDLEPCRRLARELDVPAVFTGPVGHDRVLDLFRRATVAVMPSIVAGDGDTEGLGLVALEAMGTGCPVVASDLPAVRTYLRDGDNGFLFAAGDAHALASRLSQVLADPEARRRAGRAGHASVENNFGWERAARRYADTLRTLLH